jgi:hypothetical protein
METFAVYINDQEHGPQQVLSLLQSKEPARWVLLAFPPRMSRHMGRWLSQPAKKKWRLRWSEQALQEVTQRLAAQGDRYEVRILQQAPTPKLERDLRREFGNVRIIDARRLPERWEVPASAAAMGGLVALAVE